MIDHVDFAARDLASMRKLTGALFVSLDGVIQAPGAPEEDRSGGFELGGWLAPFFDDEVGQRVDALFAPPFDLLLGRRTYDIFAAFWPYAEGDEQSIGRRFDRAAKYAVTRGSPRFEWQNSHRLDGIDAIAALKRTEGPDLVIQGSGTLYPPLLRAGLIDRLVLMTFPAIVGSGKRWFDGDTPSGAMRMVEHEVTTRGNIVAVYQPDGSIAPGSFAEEPPSAAELERRRKIDAGAW